MKDILLRIRVDDKGNVKLDDLDKKLQKVKKTTTSLGKTFEKVQSITGSLLLFTGIQSLVGQFGELNQEVLQFNKVFKQTEAITEASRKSIEALKDASIDLANNVEVSQVEIGKLGLELGKMGIENVADQLKIIPDVLNYATSGMIPLNQALQDTSQITRAFYGEDLSQYTRVVNVMHGAVSATTIETNDFIEAMKFVAPIARTMGMSIEEASALVGKLGDVGIKGSLAGTTLKNTLLNLLKPADAFKNALAQIDTKGMSLAEILAELKRRGLSVLDFLDTLNLRAITGALAIADMDVQIEKLTKSLNTNRYSVQKSAEVIRESWEDQLAKLKNSYRGVVLEFSRVFEDANTAEMFTGLKGYFENLQKYIRENRDEIRKTVQNYIDIFAKFAKFVAANKDRIISFIEAVIAAKVISGLGEVAKGFRNLGEAIVYANRLDLTGPKAWTASISTLTAEIYLAIEAYKLLSKRADAWSKQSEDRMKSGGDVSKVGAENKLKAINDFEKVLREYLSDIKKFEENRQDYKGMIPTAVPEAGILMEKYKIPVEYFQASPDLKDVQEKVFNQMLKNQVAPLMEKYKLPPEFFKAMPNLKAWEYQLGIHTNLLDDEKRLNSRLNAYSESIEDALLEKQLIRKFRPDTDFGEMIKPKVDTSDWIQADFSELLLKLDEAARSINKSILKGFEDFDLFSEQSNDYSVSTPVETNFWDKTVKNLKLNPPPSLDIDLEDEPFKEERESFKAYIDNFSKIVNAKKDANDEMLKLESDMFKKFEELRKKDLKDAEETSNRKWANVSKYVNFSANVATGLYQVYENLRDRDSKDSQEALNREKQRIEDRFNREIALAEGNEEKQAAIMRRKAATDEAFRVKQEKARREEAERNRQAALFNAIIHTAAAAVAAMAQTEGNIWVKLGAATTALVEGGVNIATILTTKYFKGGKVPEDIHGNSTSDTSLAFVSPGERILTREEDEKIGGRAGIDKIIHRKKTEQPLVINVYNPDGTKENARRIFNSVVKERVRRY